jgi:2-polyprenyl-6-methoxyphenol hydroxylase-like FAD-dependent oxidoreductase
MEDEPSSAPRAAVYTGPSVLELRRAGILEDVRKMGLTNGDVCWRKVDGEVIAGIQRSLTPGNPLNPVTLDQYRLETVILKHLEAYPNAKCLWGHKVTALDQDEHSVKITTETKEGTKVLTGEYAIGADGGKSTIRKLIDVEFEGFTWPFTIGILPPLLG